MEARVLPRGIVDSVTKPTKQTKSQTVEVDFPEDLSSSEIKVTEKSTLPAGTNREERPASPPKGADAVAIAVTGEEVAPAAVPDRPFGLSGGSGSTRSLKEDQPLKLSITLAGAAD